MHASKMHTRKIHARKMYAREVHAHETHAHQMHAHELHALFHFGLQHIPVKLWAQPVSGCFTTDVVRVRCLGLSRHLRSSQGHC